MINFDFKTLKIKVLKISKPIPKSMMNSESGILKSKIQKKKTIVASWEPKPKVLGEQKSLDFEHKAQNKKSQTLSTNPKGPIKIWVPKFEIVNNADMSKSKGKTKIMVSRQWFLKTQDRREVYVPYSNNERRRKCEI